MIEIVRLASDPGRLIAAKIRNRFSEETDGDCRQAVSGMLSRIRKEGDAALIEYCRQFDCPILTVESLRVSAAEFDQAEREVDDAFRETLQFAADRIRTFHEREMEDSWMLTRDDGAITGRLVRPVDSAGLYVPGGKEGSTPLVSSVLMNGIPAQIAGVARRVMVTPPSREGTGQPGPAGGGPGHRHRRGLQGRDLPGPSAPWPTGRQPSLGWTSSSGRATSTWPRPSVRSWAGCAST